LEAERENPGQWPKKEIEELLCRPGNGMNSVPFGEGSFLFNQLERKA